MSKQQIIKQEAEAIENQFYTKGYVALHGDKKGNGFWIYKDGTCVENDGKNSGNSRFWLMKDAKNLLASI